MFDINFPAPKMNNPKNQFCGCDFGIAIHEKVFGAACRGICGPLELLRLHVFSYKDAESLLLNEAFENLKEFLATTVLRQVI